MKNGKKGVKRQNEKREKKTDLRLRLDGIATNMIVDLITKIPIAGRGNI